MERLVDNHTHSCFSADSKMELDEAVKVAQEAGLQGIVFTDHIDLGIPDGGPQFNFDIPSQQQAIDATIKKSEEESLNFSIVASIACCWEGMSKLNCGPPSGIPKSM